MYNSSYTHVRFEVFMAATMKRAVFWDIKPQFVSHREHITSPHNIPEGGIFQDSVLYAVASGPALGPNQLLSNDYVGIFLGGRVASA
jgi:hypothetical protein